MMGKNRARSAVLTSVIWSIILIAAGLIAVFVYKQIFAGVLIVAGILILLSIPASIRNANRKADMEEMLDEYRKNKPNK